MNTLVKRVLVFILTWQARAVLRKYAPRVVAITGSVGKTATKDAVFAVLAQGNKVRRSEKSFNSELGLPLTILGVPNAWQNPLGWLQNVIDGFSLILFRSHYPQWLVLEIGADRPGDIKSVANWLKADVVLITRLPEMPVHVEFFASPEAVVKEKAELVRALRPGGVLVLFGDDERTKKLAEKTKERVLTFGFAQGVDVRGEHMALLREHGGTQEGWPLGMQAQVRVGERQAPISMLGSVGAHAFLPLLAASAVGHALGLSLEDIVEALRGYEPPRGRMRLVRGVKSTLIIDDTYNSSPAAVVAALDTLALVKQGISEGRRIAVLGDMLELGRHSVAQHRSMGVHAAKTADMLITIGFRARDMAQGALDAGMKEENILQYEDATEAGKELQNMLQPGDCILVKGSQSMRMEKTVEEIMAQPERAPELLVRQDEEWKKR